MPMTPYGIAFNKRISHILADEIVKRETGHAEALTPAELLAPFTAAVVSVLRSLPVEDQGALAMVTQAILDVTALVPTIPTAKGVH